PCPSGLSQKAGSVEQLSLHCAEGSLEWLYPTGALRLCLAPRLPPAAPSDSDRRPQHVTACVSAHPSHPASVSPGLPPSPLPPLLSRSPPDGGEKVDGLKPAKGGQWRHRGMEEGLCLAGACRPCNDTEILMAICTSDFVIRGSIRSVSNDAELQESIIRVTAARIHRQKFPLFQAGDEGGWPAGGSIRTPLRCGVKPGPGTFLFTGWLHFGEAWLSCAPRYRDFQRIYEGARHSHQNPCEFPMD
ncbi:Meteorin, partial [Calypte anna]